MEDPQEPHQEKEKSTETSLTVGPIPELPRAQERSRLGLCDEQFKDIKKEKLLENSPYIITIHNSLPNEKLFEKTQKGPPQSTNTWNPSAIGRINSLWCKKRKDLCFMFKVPQSG
jgi:hypothetical protein